MPRDPRNSAPRSIEGAANTRAAREASPEATTLWFEYARFLERTVQYERGIPVAVEARKRMRESYRANTAQDIAGSDILATLLTNNGAVAAGLNLSEETYLGARRALGDKEPLTWRTENNYAEALRMVGHPDLAAKIDAPLLKKRILHYGAGSIQALVSASNLALDYLAMGNEAGALQKLETMIRSLFRVGSRRRQAEPGSPRTRSSGTNTSCRPTSHEPIARMPSFGSSVIVTPSAFVGQRKIVRPWWRLATSSSVRASRKT